MKLWKRVAALLLSISTMGISVLSAACQGDDDRSSSVVESFTSETEKHTHTWKTRVVTEPTCTEQGLKEKFCDGCGEKEFEVIEAGHSIVRYAAQQPTCTVIGWEAYEACEKCDYTTKEVIPALEHNYVDGVCTNGCGIKEECQHDWGEYEVLEEKSCEEDGVQVRECSKCGDKEMDTIPAGHTLVYEDEIAPGCESLGYMAGYYCDECDYDERESISQTGHNFVNGVCTNTWCTGVHNKYKITIACQTEMGEQAVLEKLIEAYEKKVPDVDVELSTFSGEGFEQFMNRIAQNPDSSPNIIWTSDTYHSQWDQYFIDLRPYYEASSETDYSLYYESMLDAASTNGTFKPTKNYKNPLGAFDHELDANSDGKEGYKNQSEFGLYYAPRDYNKPAILCNTALFEKLDTDYEAKYKAKNGSMPADYKTTFTRLQEILAGIDWDEMEDLYAFAQMIAERIDFIVNSASSQSDTVSRTWRQKKAIRLFLEWEPAYTTVMNDLGIDLINNDGSLNLTANQAALETLHNKIFPAEGTAKNYVLSNNGDTEFVKENVLMTVYSRPVVLGYNSILQAIHKEACLETIPFPTENIAASSSGYAISGIYDGKGMTVNGVTKSYNDLSWDFIKFIITEEGQEVAGKTGLNIPVLKSLRDDGEWKKVEALGSMHHEAWIAGGELRQDTYNIFNARARLGFRNSVRVFFAAFQKINYGDEEKGLAGLIERTNKDYNLFQPSKNLR